MRDRRGRRVAGARRGGARPRLGSSRRGCGRRPQMIVHDRGMRVLLLVLIVLGLAGQAHADQWISPTRRTVESPNKKLQVVITPGDDGQKGATAAISENGKVVTSFKLDSKWMPVDTVLFDDGTLLALDHWHRLG